MHISKCAENEQEQFCDELVSHFRLTPSQAELLPQCRMKQRLGEQAVGVYDTAEKLNRTP